jgi:hypothetical protein
MATDGDHDHDRPDGGRSAGMMIMIRTAPGGRDGGMVIMIRTARAAVTAGW